MSTWEVCSTPQKAASVPRDEAWDKAEKVVRAGYVPGDLIVFAPEWIDPVGRLHLGDLIPVEVVARMDAAKFGRIWELSIRDAHAPETTGLRPQATKEVSGVTIKLFQRQPAVVASDVLDALPRAEISGGARPTIELAEVGFAPHRCIQVVPSPGSPVRITFRNLRLGSQLVGYVGLADVFTRRDIRAPGKLAVEIGGQVVATATAGVDDGWVKLTAPTSPGFSDVTFVASATAPQRLICFAAEARE